MKQTKHFPRAGQRLLMLVMTMLMTVSSAWAGIMSDKLYFDNEQTIVANKKGEARYILVLDKLAPLASMQLNVTLPAGVDTLAGGFYLGELVNDANLVVQKYDGTNKYGIQIQGKGTGGHLKEFDFHTDTLLYVKVRATKAMTDSIIKVTNIVGSTTSAEKVKFADISTKLSNIISYTQLGDTIAAAKTFGNYATPYDKVKQYLNSAITSAEAVIDNAPCQAHVDSTKHALYCQLLTAESLHYAMECYDIVTAPDVKVLDPTHKALYEALEDAINADPLNKAALELATEDAYRQYWYDRLADKLIMANSFSKQMDEGNAKNTLLAAIAEAESRYTTQIDLSKSSDYYRNAFEFLSSDYDTAVETANDDAKENLHAQIKASVKVNEDVIAYNDDTPNDYKTQLKGYIQTAQSLYKKEQDPTPSTLKQYRLATSTLKTNTENVIAADSTYAIGLLKNAIAVARTDSATIALTSNVLAKKIGVYIDAAQSVYDGEVAVPSTKTQKEVKTATETLAQSILAEVIGDARTALSTAIGESKTTWASMAYNDNKAILGGTTGEDDGYIKTAKDIYDDDAHTAKEYVAAKADLESNTYAVFKVDSIAADRELLDSIASATIHETSLTTMVTKLADFQTEQSAFKQNVVDPLTRAISASKTIEEEKTSTNLKKHQQALALGDSIQKAQADSITYYITQKQYLSDEYSKDKYIEKNIQKEVTVLDESGEFKAAYTHAEEVYTSVVDNEGKYDIADIIIARLNLANKTAALKTAKETWDADTLALSNKIAEAKTELAAIQLPAHQSTYDALNSAIQTAQGVFNNKKEKMADNLESATETLDAAIEAAIEADTKWSFTDAAPDFKNGTYAIGNVTYTRKGSAIAAGKFGTFCLPFDISTSCNQFECIYVPVVTAIYNTDTEKMQLFFKPATVAYSTDVIPAGTPFLAKLDVNDSVVIKNVTETYVPAQAPTPAKMTLEVYSQSANSTLLTYNPDILFQWCGTYTKITGGNDRYVFNTSAVFNPAVNGYVNSYRAYIVKNLDAPTAKSIEFNIIDGDEVTGVESIDNGQLTIDNEAGAVFNLSGQKLSSPRKGINIINGKKIIK